MTTLDSVPTSGPQEDPRYKFVYDEAVRTLDHQEATLDNLRARAGVLLTATSVATSFLGAAALRETENTAPWSGMAIVLFALVGILCIGLLWPSDWKWRLGTSKLLTDYVEAASPADLNEMYRDLALHLEQNYSDNSGRLDPMWRAFQVAAGLLALEVFFWLLALL